MPAPAIQTLCEQNRFVVVPIMESALVFSGHNDSKVLTRGALQAQAKLDSAGEYVMNLFFAPELLRGLRFRVLTSSVCATASNSGALLSAP